MGREGFGWVGRVCCLSKASKRMCLHRTNFIKNENRNHDCLLARVLDLDYRKVASANHTSYPTVHARTRGKYINASTIST